MDRRKFLRAGSSLALLPLLPWSKQSKLPITIESPHKEYIPEEWEFHSKLVTNALMFKLLSSPSFVTGSTIDVFYDIVSWRSMAHNWIAWCEGAAAQYAIPIKGIATKRIMTMVGCIDYPQNDTWDDLKLYGETVNSLVKKKIEGYSC